MTRLSLYFYALPFLLPFVNGCATKPPQCPPPRIIETTTVAPFPAYLMPACAGASDVFAAFANPGTLAVAYLDDRAALIACARQASALWLYGAQETPAPPH